MMSKPDQNAMEVSPGAIENANTKQGKKRKRVAPKTGETGEAPAPTTEGKAKSTEFDTKHSTKPQKFRGRVVFDGDSEVKKYVESGVAKPAKKSHKRDKSTPSTKAKETSNKTRESDVYKSKKPSDHRLSKQDDRLPPHLTKKRDALLPVRKALPIWSQAETIKASLKKNNVLVLTGETGSGKSTQVPQFLASEPWCTKCIAITQPRRVAAISLARRVAEEMGTFMGSQSPTAKVGYSVRFDNATGPGTKIKFLTEGMLLQEMLRDTAMSQYSAIVVDEVHERSVNVDLILGFLKNLVDDMESGSSKRKEPLKVVIMSATADVESLVEFFGSSQTPEPPTKTTQMQRQISTCFVEGRQYPVKTTYLSEPTQDWVEAALKIIFQIHYKEPLPGDILVFLTGQDTIEGLEKLVNDYAEGMDSEVPKVSCSRYRCLYYQLTLPSYSHYLFSQHSPNTPNNASSSPHHFVPEKSS
jgi:ATP-dependent RNA helicase DHR2